MMAVCSDVPQYYTVVAKIIKIGIMGYEKQRVKLLLCIIAHRRNYQLTQEV
jgi:hypothetical protein